MKKRMAAFMMAAAMVFSMTGCGGSISEESKVTEAAKTEALSMVKHISDRVGVMYLGNMVELAASDELDEKPMHPYTKALLSAIPIPDPKVERERVQIRLQGEVPSPVNPPEGCHFCNRCPYATEICSQSVPRLQEVEKGHFVACHHHSEQKSTNSVHERK